MRGYSNIIRHGSNHWREAIQEGRDANPGLFASVATTAYSDFADPAMAEYHRCEVGRPNDTSYSANPWLFFQHTPIVSLDVTLDKSRDIVVIRQSQKVLDIWESRRVSWGKIF